MGTEKYFDRQTFGLWRFSKQEVYEMRLMDKGPKLALMADYGKIDLADFATMKTM